MQLVSNQISTTPQTLFWGLFKLISEDTVADFFLHIHVYMRKLIRNPLIHTQA